MRLIILLLNIFIIFYTRIINMPRGRPKLSEEEKAQRKSNRIQEQMLEKVDEALKASNLTEVPQIVPKESIMLKSLAFGLAKDANTGFWHVIQIPFDGTTLQTGPAERLGVGEDKSLTWEHLQIAQVNEIF